MGGIFGDSRAFRSALIIALALAFAGSAMAVPGLLTVTVDGRATRIDKGTTLQQLMTKLHRHPRPGSLVDVTGITLRAAATRGRILVNGTPGALGTELQDGDVVRIIDGRDRREDVDHLRRRVEHGELTDPQFRLERVAGIETITVGSYSRKVLRVTFEPFGDPRPMKAVALTFDDGPSPTTPRILRILRKYDVPATFFVVGAQALRYPEHVRRAVKMGMTVANHSLSHPVRPVFARLKDDAMWRELRETSQIIGAHAPRPRLFRPPGGSFSPDVLRRANALGMRTVMWTVDPRDWRRGRSAKAIASSVLRKVRSGSIVVLHDGASNAAATAAALPKIIRGIRAKGLRLVAL